MDFSIIKQKLVNVEVALVAFLVLIAAVVYFPLSLANEDYFSSPDENTTYYLVTQYVNNPSMSYKYDYDIASTNGTIRPRGMVLVSNQIVPVLSNGMIIVNGMFQAVLPPSFILLFAAFTFLFSVLFYFKLITQIFDPRTALISTILYTTLAPFVYFATKPMSMDISALAFLVIGLYYYVHKKQNWAVFMLTGFFWGLCLLFNHKYIFLLGSIALAQLLVIIYTLIRTRQVAQIFRLYARKTLFLVLGIAPVLFAIGYYNVTLYGNALKDGYVAQSAVNQVVGGVKVPVFYIAYDKVLKNINTYFVNLLTPAFSLLALFSVIAIVKLPKHVAKEQKMFYLLGATCILLVTFSYFASIATWGHDTNTISASFVRYLLPLYALVLPIIVLFLLRYLPLFLSLFAISAMCVASFTYLINSHGGLESTYLYVQHAKKIRRDFLRHTNQNSVIITKYYDKMIFPYRTTLDVGSLPVDYDGELYKIRLESLISSIEHVLTSKEYVYLVKDIEPDLYQQTYQALQQKGLVVHELKFETGILVLAISKT